jgi:hypothetical protein
MHGGKQTKKREERQMAAIDRDDLASAMESALDEISEAKSSLALAFPLLNDKDHLVVRLGIKDAMLRLDEIAEICEEFTGRTETRPMP